MRRGRKIPLPWPLEEHDVDRVVRFPYLRNLLDYGESSEN